MRTIEAVVLGRVQGVGFRWSCCREAESLGLRGWVRNEADGSVRVLAQGPDAAVDALVAWLRHGPPGAVVSSCTVGDPGGDTVCGPGFRVAGY